MGIRVTNLTQSIFINKIAEKHHCRSQTTNMKRQKKLAKKGFAIICSSTTREKKNKNKKKEGRKSRFQKMFWFGMMGLGRLIRSVTNSRRKRNYKKSKDLIERKTKQKKD